MSRNLIFALAFVALLGAGAFEYAQSRRRADPEAAQQIQAKLDTVPLSFGDWVGTTADFDAKVMKQTGAVAHLYRKYARAKSGDSVEILLLAGDPGEIGVHDPERCYGGVGFQPVGTRRRQSLSDPLVGEHSYWSARFDAETFPATALQVCWGWSADGRWSAAEDARFEYLGQSTLYKIYATRRLNPSSTGTADPTADFLSDFLPAVRASLTGTPR
jgi:hypothetical protein